MGVRYENVTVSPRPEDVLVVVRSDDFVVVTDNEREARRALRVVMRVKREGVRKLRKYGNVLHLPGVGFKPGIYRLDELPGVLEEALIMAARERARGYLNEILWSATLITKEVPVVEDRDAALRVDEHRSNYLFDVILPTLRRKALRSSRIELTEVTDSGLRIERIIELLEFRKHYAIAYDYRYYITIRKGAGIDDMMDCAEKLGKSKVEVLTEVAEKLGRACGEDDDLCRTVLELLTQAAAVASLML